MLRAKRDRVCRSVEYHGVPGITARCLDAIVRLIHYGETIERVFLLSCDSRHGFLLELQYEQKVVVKTGFRSGYPGEGPRGLAMALLLLKRHCDCVDEFDVSSSFLERLDSSCLLQSDFVTLERLSPVRPVRYHDYIYDRLDLDDEDHLDGLLEQAQDLFGARITRIFRSDHVLNSLFPSEIPFSILDERIVDLAFKFKTDPDAAILSGYKRLEGIIRERVGGTDRTGSKLIGDAFLKGPGTLYWDGLHDTEQRGRVQIFAGAFMSFRNRRAHNEVELSDKEELREFLLVNELFLQERAAKMLGSNEVNA